MSVLAVTCVAVAAQAVVAAPTLQVEPPDVLEGQRVIVRIAGLPPGDRVTLHLARLHDRDPTGQEVFRGRAAFVEANTGRNGS